MNYETIELKTKRLLLKKGTIDDFLKVYEYNFKKLTDIDGIFKLEKHNKKKIEKTFENDIKKYYEKAKNEHIFDWIIYFNELPIGNIVTEKESLYDKSIYLYFNIHPAYWGYGYMPEALNEVIKYLYSIGYESIICKYGKGNIKAKKILSKIGFKSYMIEENSYISENGNQIDECEVILNKEDFLSNTLKLSIEKLKI